MCMVNPCLERDELLRPSSGLADRLILQLPTVGSVSLRRLSFDGI